MIMIRATWKNRTKSRMVPLTHVNAIIVAQSFLVQIRVARGQTFKSVIDTREVEHRLLLFTMEERGDTSISRFRCTYYLQVTCSNAENKVFCRALVYIK